MQILKLSPNKIVTLNDFPVYDEHVLKIYFRVYQKGYGKAIPPCPIMHKDLVIPFFDDNLKKLFTKFIKNNPTVEYFMLDGSHKTTAATLTNHKIKAMVFKDEKDILEAKDLAKAGELFHYYLKDTIQDIVKELAKHFKKTKLFQTVEEKTEKMKTEKVIPKYMGVYYKK